MVQQPIGGHGVVATGPDLGDAARCLVAMLRGGLDRAVLAATVGAGSSAAESGRPDSAMLQIAMPASECRASFRTVRGLIANHS